jgi:dihydrofolate synthase/folylpolyglutamate synthase
VLANELSARPVAGRTIAVLGMLEDKDVAAVAAKLAPQVDHWLLCSLRGARALSDEALQRRIGAQSAPVELAGGVEDATRRAALLARPGDRVLVCGSFHTVGPALEVRQLY